MTLEEYRKLVDDLKRAQGALNFEVTKDLQRLASAELNTTKVKINEAYERGLKEAWELAQQLALREADGGMSCEDFFKCYGDNLCYQDVLQSDVKEALQKYKGYMQKKKAEQEEKQFHVGDEVVSSNGTKIIVVKVYENGTFSGIDRNGESYTHRPSCCFSKTGSHYEVIAKVLAGE